MDNYDPRRLGQGYNLTPQEQVANIYGQGKYPSTALKATQAYERQQAMAQEMEKAQQNIREQRLAQQQTLTPLRDTIQAVTQHHERPQEGHGSNFEERMRQRLEEAKRANEAKEQGYDRDR